MGQLFGTDGIRGIANNGLDAMLAFRVGQAAAIVLAKGKKGRPFITIGKDTRLSSDMLEAALVAGICSSGADVMPLGVIPTPAVAYITSASGADAGIVISASHNPYIYNGIKIFNASGFKLSDELELEIENLVLDSENELPLKPNGDIGRILHGGEGYVERYIDSIRSLAIGIRCLSVVVDCANGAASRTAEKIFSSLPLNLHMIANRPDGININERCGSTDTTLLSEEVQRIGADIGIAFDGDADRCMIVDEKGSVVDGDKMLAICGTVMKQEGQLKNNIIVSTVMSNIGFKIYARERGITLLCADVGDRNVLEMMQERGACLGGEKSGHLIFLDNATSGDGQLAAVKFLNVLSKSGKTVSELVTDIREYPYYLLNVEIEGGNESKSLIMNDHRLLSAIEEAEQVIGENGRILVRPSGTEALIRIMVEATDNMVAKDIAEKLSELVKKLAKA